MFESIDYKWVLAILAALISFSNLLFYLWTVLKGQTKPHFYTWLIWGIITLVILVAQIKSSAGFGAILTAIVAFNCLLIAAVSFFKGTTTIQKSDNICLAFCFIAIILWPLTGSPVLSVLLVTAIDGAGFIPTFRKSFNAPHEENIFSFSIYAITWSMGIIALEQYNFLTLFYPIFMVVAPLSLVLFLVIRRYQLGYKILK